MRDTHFILPFVCRTLVCATMSDEAYKMAGRQAMRYARFAARNPPFQLGRVAGVAMGVGVASALGSVQLFATALEPTSSAYDEMRLFKGFNEATSHRYSADDVEATERAALAAAAGAAALSVARPAARRL